MHSAERVEQALRLAATGLRPNEVAALTGIPRRTISDWLSGRMPSSAHRAPRCPRCGSSIHRFEELSRAYAYLLGTYLGDGCISVHPRDVFRLRITLDLRYPAIVDECEDAVRRVMGGRVGRVLRTGTDGTTKTHVDVSSYSKSWPCFLPQHGPGKKHLRRIELTPWQQVLVRRDPQLLLRGLIHSDGCRALNTGTNWRHPRYSFYNHSEEILGIFVSGCEQLGLHYTRAPHVVYVSRKRDVALLDTFIGPKR